MTDKRREVEELRQEIGKVDAQLLACARAPREALEEVGEARKSLASPSRCRSARKSRRSSRGAAAGDLPPEALREIFREIVATCFSLEAPVVVAFCGLEGAFAHAAARSRFGVAAEYTPCDTVAAALDEVTRQRASYAVVPYETRTDGLMQATIAALTPSDLKIVACFETVVNLQLASKAGSLAEIEKVYAIAKDRAHCQRFLATELPGAQVMDVEDADGRLPARRGRPALGRARARVDRRAARPRDR